MSNWSHFKDGIEYDDIRKYFLNKCKELKLKSKYINGEIIFEDVDSYDYFMGNFSDDGVLSIYYPFTLKKEYFMSNFENYDEFLAQFIDIYDSAMIEKRLHKTESKKFAKKSLQEGIDIKIEYCDDTPSEYIDDVTMNDIYDILDSSSDICKIVDVSGSKKKVVWTDEYGFEKAYKESLKESNIPNKVYDILDKLASNFILDYKELVEFERNGLEHHFDKIRELGAKLNKAENKNDDDLYDEIANEIVMVVKRANGTLKESIKESSNKKVSDFKNTNTEFVAIMDIEDFYDEDGNASVLWQGKSSDLKKSDFYDFTVLETEPYDKVLYLFVDIAEF